MDLGAEHETTADGFLGRRIVAVQPKRGFRAGSDTIFLAAAVPAKPGERVLELGLGAGVASLALAARIGDLALTGLEIEGDLARLARTNFETNASAGAVTGTLEVVEADAAAPLEARFAGAFDHVFLNPPFFPAESSTEATDPGRARGRTIQKGELDGWLAGALFAARPGATITVLHRAGAIPAILSGLGTKAGDFALFPLWPGRGRPARTVILQGTVGSNAPFRLLPGVGLHAEEGAFTPLAESVLRHGAALDLGRPE